MSLLKRDTDLTHLFSQTLQWNLIGCGGKEFDTSEERKNLQHDCLLEELYELECAINAQDKEEIVDAICDILFVAVYAYFLAEGVDKGIDNAILDTDYEIYDLCTQLKGLCAEYRYLSMITLITNTSYLFDFDLKRAYEHVLICNFSKFPLIEDVRLEAELDWFATHSKYTDVVAKEIVGHFVFRQDNGKGKIVKPRCTKQPDLKQFI